MKQGRLRLLGALVVLTCSLFLANTSRAQAKSASGKLTGIVNDAMGVPQLGATVEVVPESAAFSSHDFLTNIQGMFRGDRLTPGYYSVRVTLAGFLPTLERHIHVGSHLTTVVHIQLESMFASIDQLRRQPSSAPVEGDDWKWVLRSASMTRPVLQWVDDDSLSASNEDIAAFRPRGRLEFTDGARRPGSASNLPSSPATAFAYDQKLGGNSQLLLAGEMNYEGDSPGGGVATVWLPSGSLGAGPHTALVLREAKLGPGSAATFRGVRIEQGGSLNLGDRVSLNYGGEYVLVGLTSSATALRPRLEVNTRVSDDWQTSLVFASEPGGPTPLEAGTPETGNVLAAALNELDSFPTLLWRDGRPVLEGGWHEEIAAQRKAGQHGKVQVAAFHDDNRHVAVFGRGNGLPAADYIQDYFSNGFAYDGGSSSSWGTRVALSEKLSDDLEVTTVYSFAGVLTPSDLMNGPLRDVLRTAMRHSLAANASQNISRTHTKITVGYKWLNGAAVSRLDSYGEALFQTEPYLHVGVRQSLPKFGPGRWEAIADCDNLFAQGYVSTTSRDGGAVLVPAFRTFRGGLSLQF